MRIGARGSVIAIVVLIELGRCGSLPVRSKVRAVVVDGHRDRDADRLLGHAVAVEPALGLEPCPGAGRETETRRAVRV